MASHTASLSDTESYSDLVPMYPPSTWRIIAVATKSVVISEANGFSTLLSTTESYTDSLVAKNLVPSAIVVSLSDTESYTTSLAGGKYKTSTISHYESYTDSVFLTPPISHHYSVMISDKESYTAWMVLPLEMFTLIDKESYTDKLIPYKDAVSPSPRLVKITISDTEGSRD